MLLIFLFLSSNIYAKDLIINCLVTKQMVNEKNKEYLSEYFTRIEFKFSKKDSKVYITKRQNPWMKTLEYNPIFEVTDPHILSGTRRDGNLLPTSLEIDRISGKGLYSIFLENFSVFYYMESCTNKPKNKF